jgi:hypothetical protein
MNKKYIKYIICIILTGTIVYSISYYVNINYDYNYNTLYNINICKDLITTILNPGYGWFGCLLKCIGNVIFYIILSLGINYILNNIKFVFLSILAFIFSYALLKDFNNKHFYKKWKGNIIGFMIKLLECKRFLIFYLIFLILSFISRNIIRNGVLFLLEKDDILCYILVVLLSITIIIYVSNILWKVLNSLLWIFSGWLTKYASPLKDGFASYSSEINKENITAEDFYLFNQKVTNNVTIYNCIYIILIIYINQNFPSLYFMIIVCCFIILLIIIWLFSIKKNKNIVIFSPRSASYASPPGMNHTLKSAIPFNPTTFVGIIGGTLCAAQLDLDNAIESNKWKFENGKKYLKEISEDKVYTVKDTISEGKIYPMREEKARLWNIKCYEEIRNNGGSQILKIVDCYERQIRLLNTALRHLNADLEYNLKSIRVASDHKWILGKISSKNLENTKIYVLSLFAAPSDPDFTISKNNIFYPSYHINGSERYRLTGTSKNMYKADIPKNTLYDGGIVITPGRLMKDFNMIQIPRIVDAFKTDLIRKYMTVQESNIESIRERKENGPQHEGERIDSIFNNGEDMFNNNAFIKENNAFIHDNIMKNYLIPLLEKLGDGNKGSLPLMEIVKHNYSNYNTLESVWSKTSDSKYTSDHYVRGQSTYKVFFNIGKFNLSGTEDVPNLGAVQHKLTLKREDFVKTCKKDINQGESNMYGVNIVNNWMEILHMTRDEYRNEKLYNIAFLDKNYFAEFPDYSVHNPSTIYNIFNSDSQLKRFFEYIHSGASSPLNNNYIFLTFDDNKWKQFDITKAPKYNMDISFDPNSGPNDRI